MIYLCDKAQRYAEITNGAQKYEVFLWAKETMSRQHCNIVTTLIGTTVQCNYTDMI